MTDSEFHSYTMSDEDDTVMVAAFGIFTRKDLEKMKFAGYSPVVIMGKEANNKVRLEPFMIVGNGADTVKAFMGFVHQVWKKYTESLGNQAGAEKEKNEETAQGNKA